MNSGSLIKYWGVTIHIIYHTLSFLCKTELLWLKVKIITNGGDYTEKELFQRNITVYVLVFFQEKY